MTDADVQMTKDFGSIQKDFFLGVLKNYFSPLKALFLFLSIPLDLVRHFVISMMMDESEHERYNQMKFDDEVQELYADTEVEVEHEETLGVCGGSE